MQHQRIKNSAHKRITGMNKKFAKVATSKRTSSNSVEGTQKKKQILAHWECPRKIGIMKVKLTREREQAIFMNCMPFEFFPFTSLGPRTL